MANFFGQFDRLGLSTYLVRKLQKKCITTKYELLISNNNELMEITGLSDVAILELKQKLAEDYFPRQHCVSQADKLNTKVYKTGIKSLDQLTAKVPLKSSSVWEVCGIAAIGKTQLCHTIALNFVEQQLGTVLYVDTKCDFSGKRIMEMLRSRNVSNTDCGRIMQDILVERTLSAEGILEILNNLSKQVAAGADADGGNVKLVIIDALPAIFFNYRTEGEKLKGKYLLATLNNLVYKLSKEQHIAFIHVNLLMNFEEEKLGAEDGDVADYDLPIEDMHAINSSPIGCKSSMRPALGEYWSRAPHLRLSIEPMSDCNVIANERTLKILRSCYSTVGDMCTVRITSAGIL